MLLAPDVSLGSRYTLRSRVAVGGMGEVWRAEDTVLHREVAVKVLKSDLSGDPTFLDRFRAEARHTAALAHPGIASVFDYGEATTDGSEQTNTAYLVMELIDGEPMSALLARDGRLSPDQALDILAQTAQALGAAHAAGVIHRDVKPGNILIRPDGTVKITDFGIARAVNAAPVTATGMVMGTSYYLSPEQAGGQLVTPASDLYSLGVVGYEALTGHRPFTGDNPLAVAMMHIREEPAALPSDVPGPARAVIDRAMAKDPAARFPTAETMAEAATAARAGAPWGPQPTEGIGVLPPVTDLAATSVLPTAASAATPPSPAPPADPISPDDRVAAAPPPPPTAAGRRPGLAVLLLAALLAFLLFAVLAHLATRRLRGEPSGRATPTTPTAPATPTTTRPAAPSTVTVDRASYVDEPYEEVAMALSGLGLTVRPVLDGKGGKPGTVTQITPAGAVPAGSTITITVVPPKGKGDDDEKKEE